MKPIPVRTPAGRFPSLVAAAERYGVSPTAMRARIARGREGYGFEGQRPVKDERLVPVVTPLGEFHSVYAAARRHNLTSEGLRYRVLAGHEGYRFADEAQRPRTRRAVTGRPAKPVRTPTGDFPSAAEAAVHHGLTVAAARWRATVRYQGWGYVEARESPSTQGGEADGRG